MAAIDDAPLTPIQAITLDDRTERGMRIIEFLERLEACEEAVDWARSFGSLEQLWYYCPRIEWMLWMLERIGHCNETRLRLFAATCARRNESLLSDPRSRWALDIADRAARYGAGPDDLRAARYHGRQAAEDAAQRPDWSQARAAAATAAWCASRTSAFRAARDTSHSALRACAWNLLVQANWQDEEKWQTDLLRTFLDPDLPVILELARRKAMELTEERPALAV